MRCIGSICKCLVLVRGSGPRRVARQYFPLERMTNFLRRAVETIYGVISLVQPQNVKPVISLENSCVWQRPRVTLLRAVLEFPL